MSTPIPEDVMIAAKAACDVHGIPAMGAPFHPSDACRVAMTAIMAEREACAAAAAGNSSDFDFGKALAECRDTEHGFHSGRLHAASAIRDRSKS